VDKERHELIHSATLRYQHDVYQCDHVGCNRSFCRLDLLQRHRARHRCPAQIEGGDIAYRKFPSDRFSTSTTPSPITSHVTNHLSSSQLDEQGPSLAPITSMSDQWARYSELQRDQSSTSYADSSDMKLNLYGYPLQPDPSLYNLSTFPSNFDTNSTISSDPISSISSYPSCPTDIPSFLSSTYPSLGPDASLDVTGDRGFGISRRRLNPDVPTEWQSWDEIQPSLDTTAIFPELNQAP
jgi:hypothetical protein